MKDGDTYLELLGKIKEYFSKMMSEKMTLSDYYFAMADYFNNIKPSNGYHQGVKFDFKEDAAEFVNLAKSKLREQDDKKT